MVKLKLLRLTLFIYVANGRTYRDVDTEDYEIDDNCGAVFGCDDDDYEEDYEVSPVDNDTVTIAGWYDGVKCDTEKEGFPDGHPWEFPTDHINYPAVYPKNRRTARAAITKG